MNSSRFFFFYCNPRPQHKKCSLTLLLAQPALGLVAYVWTYVMVFFFNVLKLPTLESATCVVFVRRCHLGLLGGFGAWSLPSTRPMRASLEQARGKIREEGKAPPARQRA